MCCGCGVCAGICPTKAITIKIIPEGINYPVLDKSKCVSCGKCKQVCPGFGFDVKELNMQVFGKVPENPLIGNYQSILKGYSADKDLRYNCSSGGIITTLLVELMRSKTIEGAIVTRLVYAQNIRAEAFIANTEQEIIDAKGSKYCPVSLDGAVSALKKKPRKVAVVCLPCHAIALRKAMAADKTLQESIVYIFALFCNQTPSYKALKHYLKQHNVLPENVSRFQWRGDGWPGKTKVILKNQQEFCEPFTQAWGNGFGSGYFTPLSCYCCQDFFGEFADVSFGDAWLPEQQDDTVGTNVIIARSNNGKQIVKSLFDARKIVGEDISLQAIRSAFAANTVTRKNCYPLHAALIRNSPVVKGRVVFPSPSFKIALKELIRLVKLLVGAKLYG